MPSAELVRPNKWAEMDVLFDNGEYSVISGKYDGGTRYGLGERWNGGEDDPLGFPNVAGYPIWHVVPDFLSVAILQGSPR